ncbi:MAG: NADH-quinone oxidoreductase subunit L [Bacteroidia bacterium]|nr:NADH-quinone oxidoreductase subunit L [Bacteroidia bacterium]
MAYILLGIVLLPLLGSIINGLLGKKLSKSNVATIASGSIGLSFVLSIIAFIQLQSAENRVINVDYYKWVVSGMLDVPMGFWLDSLSSLYILVITGVGFLIHVYSIGYMHEDDGFSRYFSYLNLFVFFMLMLVLGNSYVTMFVGWEGVGLCSYLLIGFWFKNHAYNDAAKKAFIMNRIGDLGFILGMALLFITYGSLNYADLNKPGAITYTSATTAIALLLFLGATGKSAQIPLYTWLPDAMAGPTPVSALIHAATMVTAGIYMVVRSNAIYSLSETASLVVGIVGGVTALWAAIIATLQFDIKKILAYSTVSQLGLMFLGLGANAYSSSVFHVITHAFFKALLFLGAGSVIHAMGGEQDIRKMGGLSKKIPTTYLTMLIATIAISGIPPFSGFFSKDEILAHVYEYNKGLWALGVIASMLTAFYMFRMLFLTFWGYFRGGSELYKHLHESPSVMTIPLMILAVLSVIGGLLGLPELIGAKNWIGHYLDNVILIKTYLGLSHSIEWMLMGIAVAGAVASIYFAYQLFVINGVLPVEDEAELKWWQKIIYHKFYVDELYDFIIRRPIDFLGKVVDRFFEKMVFNGINDSISSITLFLGEWIRKIHIGNIAYYIMAMTISIIVILSMIK